jgi:hypothetical protein
VARWFATGDPDFVPAELPAARAGSAYAVVEGALWVLGGWNAGYAATTATVYRFDPIANEWSIETPVGFAFESASRAVAVGELIYFATFDGDLHSYHTGTGVTTTIGPSGAAGYHDLVLIEGYIYIGLAGPDPQRYDLLGATWSAAPGTSPYVDDFDDARAVAYGGWIAVTGGHDGDDPHDDAWLYNPQSGSWWPLPDLPVAAHQHVAEVFRDQLHVLVGEDTFVLDRDHAGWSTPYDAAPSGRTSAASGVLLGQLLLAGGFDDLASEIVASAAMLGDGLDSLEATGSVDFAFTVTDAWLSASADVDGGPGVVASVVASAVTGRTREARLTAYADVIEDASPHGPVVEYGELGVGDGPEVLVEPGVGAWAGDVAKPIGEYLSYALIHALGDGVTGSASVYGRAAPAGLPGYWPDLEWSADLRWDWRRGDAVTTTADAVSLSRQVMDETFLAELMPVEAIEGVPGGHNPPPCLYGPNAELCSQEAWDAACAAKLADTLASVLPTKRELAIAAAAEVGVTLAIREGPGLHGLDELVDKEYRTENRTPTDVVSDMLLTTRPRIWYLPSVMVIDGTGLPEGSLAAPAGDLSGPSALWLDAAVASASITVERAAPQEPLAAPDPADFDKQCDEEVDGCDERTFETLDTGILQWSEWADQHRIDHYLRKANGQVVEERRVTFGPAYSFNFAGFGSYETTLEPIEQTQVDHVYYGCCSGALRQSQETTSVISHSPLTGAAAWRVDRQKQVVQRYHAEGWLVSRFESSREWDGWIKVEVGGFTQYTGTFKTTSRSERYRPIGKGIWAIDISTTDRQPKPIMETTTVGDETTTEVVGMTYAVVTNSYTQMTDGGPPTVSCGEADPCNPDETCEERATRLYGEAVEDYERQLASDAATAANRPERLLRQTFTLDEAWQTPALGDLINTSRGPAVVVRVGWSGGTPQSGSPGDQIQVEAWSRLP